MSLSQFLIRLDHEKGALHQDAVTHADPAEALRTYDATERYFAEQAHIEVVGRASHIPVCCRVSSQTTCRGTCFG